MGTWSTGHVDSVLLPNILYVGHCTTKNVPKVMHALVKLLIVDADDCEQGRHAWVPGGFSKESSEGFSEEIKVLNGNHGDEEDEDDNDNRAGVNVLLVHDIDGMTVIVNERFYRYLDFAAVTPLMTWASNKWRALEIHLGPAGAESPGIISYLSSRLSEINVSILNFSTFETDLILVQEYDLKQATDHLKTLGRDGVHGLQEQMIEQTLLSKAVASSPKRGIEGNLTVIKSTLQLLSIRRDMLKQSMFGLMKQLTQNIDAAQFNTSNNQVGDDFLWAYFSTKDEVSLLVDERDVIDYPEESIIVCPQQWRAIRLSGKDIPFDETGIVKVMSSPFEEGIQLLNLSTYKTNVTLVLNDSTDVALARLKQELRQPRYGDL